MARISRKKPLPAEPVLPSAEGREVWRTAAYIRQSHEELFSGERGNRLENQEQVIRNYLKGRPEFCLLKVYADNGFSGTDFLRPAFTELLKDVQKGKIQCVVVKDLSRLGRNYIETEQYLRLFFPKWNVRFVSVNDRIDSVREELDITASLKNIINDAYAKDISRKIFSTKQAQQRCGDFVGNLPPYGYRKTAADPHRLEPDPEVEAAVRELFAWKLQEHSCGEIARHMNAAGFPSPMAYRYRKGLVHQEKFADSEWKTSTVKCLLKNPMYTGDMVQGKKRRYLAGGKKKTEICPPEDYVVVPNRHAPLVAREDFERVQKLLELEVSENRKKRNKNQEIENTENLLEGKICSSEGEKMYRGRHVYGGNRVVYYYMERTAGDRRAGKSAYISEKRLFAILYQVIGNYMELLVSTDAFFHSVCIQRAISYREQILKQRRERLERRRAFCLKRISELYQSFCAGQIEKSSYELQADVCRKEEKDCKKQLEQLEQNGSFGELPLDILEKYRSISCRPEPELIRKLVEKVVVESREKVHIHLAFADEMNSLQKRIAGERV